jgi:hypothetical protein
MNSAPSNIGLDDSLKVAHDQAAEVMVELTTDTNIPEEDRRALQVFYNEWVELLEILFQRPHCCPSLEKRQLWLNVEESDISEKEYPEGLVSFYTDTGNRLTTIPAEIEAKAVGFATFLSTLDPREASTRLLLEATNLVTIALGKIERGADFMENVPMPQVLDVYERCSFLLSYINPANGLICRRIQSHEATMAESGSPVSMVNAVIYLSEATTFSDMINILFVRNLSVG